MTKRRVVFLSALGALALLFGSALAQSPGSHEHSFRNAEKWAEAFDDPARDAWQKPEEVIRALGLAPDAVVADIGSGTGYFAVRLARAVPKGRVLGVDLEPDMVRYLNQRARREGLSNLASQQGAKESPRLAAPVDLALVVDTYHHIAAREKYFERLRASLRPGGRLAIIDFRVDAQMGPARHARVAPEQVKRELARAGFELEREHPFLPNQYFLVFRPKSG